MTPEAMVSLRLAATVAHALPGVQLRLRDGGRTVLVVAGPGPGAGVAMSPCQLRMMVARAHAKAIAGTSAEWSPGGPKVTVDVAVRRGDHAWPDGCYRIAVGGVHVHGFATTLAPRRCRELLTGQPASEWVAARLDVRLYHDAATAVTLVHTSTPAALAVERPEALGGLLGRAVAEAAISELAQMPAR